MKKKSRGSVVFAVGIIFWQVLTLIGSDALGQSNEVMNRYAGSITTQDLRKRLEVLASDSLEGRETGKLGQKKAATYIENQFKSFGIPKVDRLGSYQQSYTINVTFPDTVLLISAKDTFRFLEDIYYFNLQDMHISVDQLTYLGYGIDAVSYSDYAGKDVKDKVLMVSSGEPKKGDKSLIDTSFYTTDWTSDWEKKIIEAEKRGAIALLVIDSRFSSSVVQLGRYIKRPTMDVSGEVDQPAMPVIFISSKVANKILKTAGIKKGHQFLEKRIEKDGAPISKELVTGLTLQVKRHKEKVVAENVLGYIEGTDKKEELVVISCHYDHLGKDEGKIYYGADDDGSGTTSLIEMAEAFALAKREGNGPRRSMLFIAFSGEEKGLLGSEFYSKNPVFPLEKTMVNLNIDMIGRIDKQHEPDSNYVYLIGADKISQELHNLSELTNVTHTQLKLDYTYNDENDPNQFYYRSDHYNFAKNGVPVIFYFTGVHDDYHQPTDTVDKIQFVKMKRIVDLIFYTAWELANREKSIR
jgi:hypothetical protein